MKNSAEYAKKLNKLCTSLKKTVKETDDPIEGIDKEPANILLLGCLSEFASISKAHTAYQKIRSCYVDYNELRVSRPREIVAILGKNYPKVNEVTDKIIQILNAVFNKYNGLEMASLADMGKREAQAAIKELNGITPYIYSFFIMYYIDAHAFPLNDNMLKCLVKEDVVNPASDFDDVHGFMERQIPAAKVHEIFRALRHHCDSNIVEEVAEPEDKTAAKKTAKKTAVKKTVAKKTVAKKTVEKKTVAKKTTKKAAKKSTK